uniref:Metaxin-1 n=1 Tax=Anolis carolinensis TaxID=28377 RepID=A0A803ST91_ANOCA
RSVWARRHGNGAYCEGGSLTVSSPKGPVKREGRKERGTNGSFPSAAWLRPALCCALSPWQPVWVDSNACFGPGLGLEQAHEPANRGRFRLSPASPAFPSQFRFRAKQDGGSCGVLLLGGRLGPAVGGPSVPGRPGTLPALKTPDEGVLSDPQQIITYLRKQRFNADYDLSARQGADTLAFVSLLQEKLLPVLIHTFWVDAKNYVELTRKWYAEAIPFPLNFFLPGRMQKQQLERLQTVCGENCLENEEELEKELYREARECLTLLSQRLGQQKFFFGDSPASLDAVVFSHLAPLLKAKLPNAKIQQHLKSLPNLCNYCTSILSLYFPWDEGDPPPPVPKSASSDGSESEEEPHKRRNQVLSVLVGLLAMVGYALLTGIVSVQKQGPGTGGRRAIALDEEEEEEEEE